jgi:hypothetical protein
MEVSNDDCYGFTWGVVYNITMVLPMGQVEIHSIS